MLEPENNPNPAYIVDPPRLLRFVMARALGRVANTEQIAKKRVKAEKARQAAGSAHVVEYFHQVDDPYSYLMAQVLERFVQRYDIELVPHLIRATGGRNQPEEEKLAVWARRDCGLIAPHYGLSFPETAGVRPESAHHATVNGALAALGPDEFVAQVQNLTASAWSDTPIDGAQATVSETETQAAIMAGSARLAELGHYSGAMLYYGGEWYWGVDRLFHLEQRLRDLDACKSPDEPYIVPRPEIDVSDVDASGLDLHFFPSLNSPYTSIIYDSTVALAQACNVNFHLKPVLPMIMRGVAATTTKGTYIFFDTKREGDFFGVPFGKHVTPIGEPTRQAYSLFPWARSQGKDTELLSILLRYAWSEGRGLHKQKYLKMAVEEVGLDWTDACQQLGTADWQPYIEQHQDEMVEGMGLWGVPSYRLCGPDGEPDLEVWGQDRLWLVAAEIRRRVALSGA
ncbi:2-hydroxychromene-2-carboxylate isomerase [Halioglobus japonicus]|uniref:2-hydroxychromene-2-carboxylate isomerase n=1 Tax=Halioglobus japonicus TaxID=930805 RepID=A0AAP8MFQ6_9GAMM|nr:DsbA family protein [Halioglobus japonicus]AQA20213.1 2-hydroxychromene-2-carboxylate isomerase [Halioglobus japonicus]PLW86961.1 2-hydroxychromene-2-carboxylate isomerase [Halioglobus japonicus]GHD13824.1 2-hydroxychromene-2-carboxylate isomerase [Halioglobus japonicus]